AIFSLFHSLMLRMLPVERPEELVSMFRTGGWGRGFVSYPLYQEIARRSDLFTGVIGRSGVAKVRFTSRAGARGEFCQREFVTGNYFSMLGVTAALGRVFSDDDNRTQGAHPVAVISYDLWRNRYGADPNILGARVLVAEKPFTIIGVAAAGFHGVEFERRAEVWVPAAMADVKLTNPNSWWIWVVARRRPEVPAQQVQAAIDVLMRQHLNALYPSGYDAGMRQRALGQRLEVRDAAIGLSLLRDEFSRPLAILLGAVILVLLAACVNVANLLLARGAARRKEIALRLSLGATRQRLLTQALTESVLLMIAGSALGAGLAGWGQRLVIQFLPERAGNPFSSAPSVPVLAFTLAISAMSVLLFGLGPALRSTSVDPAAGLRPGSVSRTGPLLLRRVLVVAQVAFSVVLVAMAALFGHNLYALRGVDLGFRNQNVVAFSLDFPRELRRDERASTHQLAAQLAELPGVSSVSYGFPGPFLMGTSSISIRVPGSERTSRDSVDVQTANIAPHYFETIGAQLTAGREFEPGDTESARKVAVVNEAFVREFLPGEQHPELRRVSFDNGKAEEGEPIFIVGVVRDIRHSGIQAQARPTVYVPIEQRASAIGPTMLVRTQAPPTAMLPLIYRELRRVNPSIAVTDLRTLRSSVDDSIFEQRLLAAVGAFFGALALVLAAVGLYGVVAYATARRTAEIGVRIALGARRPQVIWMILRDSLAMVACGLGIGLPAALVSARAVQSMLFEIRPGDPPALLVTGLTLAAVGVVAAHLPARRAASVDPARVLRAE
ncbi:MAG TPA: ABC transporter permease, partial [Candidatus Acidoferrum sp.]|nr:ABC transporter permease [Candidatus Acidoferrum sp.]